MPNFYNMLKPITTQKETAYYIEDVLKLFTPARRKTFDAWLTTQEITVINDKDTITQDKLEEFFNTLTV